MINNRTSTFTPLIECSGVVLLFVLAGYSVLVHLKGSPERIYPYFPTIVLAGIGVLIWFFARNYFVLFSIVLLVLAAFLVLESVPYRESYSLGMEFMGTDYMLPRVNLKLLLFLILYTALNRKWLKFYWTELEKIIYYGIVR